MKKKWKIFGLVFMVAAVSFFVACSVPSDSDTTSTEGTTSVDETDTASTDDSDTASTDDSDEITDAGWGGTFAYTGYDCLDLQVWESTFTVDIETSGMTIYPSTVGWVGGGVVATDGNSVFDLTEVDTISFDIRGDMPTTAIKIYVQSSTDGDLVKNSLSSGTYVTDVDDTDDYNETTFTTYNLDISSLTDTQKADISNVFTIVLADTGYDASCTIEVANIDYLDSDGNQIIIGYDSDESYGSDDSVGDDDTTVATDANSYTKEGMTLVWHDEFDTGTLPDTDNWQSVESYSNYNNEEQHYISDSTDTSDYGVDYSDVAYIEDGYLNIKAIKNDNEWYSAKLTTQDIHDKTYGYFEASIKAPSGTGVWPAFWMMPDNNVYGDWPSSGEIDIWEYGSATEDEVYTTLHYGEAHYTDAGDYYTYYTQIANEEFTDASSDFHTYAVKWTADSIHAYYDDVAVGSYYYSSGKDWDEWPFDYDFYVILNLAMGGTLGGDIDASLTSATMKVDWVRVWSIDE